MFLQLSEDRFFERVLPSVLITAKGMPDLSTRAFLHSLTAAFPTIPVLGDAPLRRVTTTHDASPPAQENAMLLPHVQGWWTSTRPASQSSVSTSSGVSVADWKHQGCNICLPRSVWRDQLCKWLRQSCAQLIAHLFVVGRYAVPKPAVAGCAVQHAGRCCRRRLAAADAEGHWPSSPRSAQDPCRYVCVWCAAADCQSSCPCET